MRRLAYTSSAYTLSEKHDDLISAALVVVDEVLAGLELPWAHHTRQCFVLEIGLQIFFIEISRHFAPNFSTLNAGNMSLL